MPGNQQEFWSKVAQEYDEVVDLQIGSKTRSMVRERVLREHRLGVVAEFGSGTGFYTAVLATRADHVVATDISPAMLGLTRSHIQARNVTFQLEDVQETSFGNEAFDTAFMSLLIHFTEPRRTLQEMLRILKPGGTLIVSNLDPEALHGWNRLRCLIRIVYQGFIGYRIKPPAGFGKNVLTEKQLYDLLEQVGFKMLSAETIKDMSRSSNIPVEYIRAAKI